MVWKVFGSMPAGHRPDANLNHEPRRNLEPSLISRYFCWSTINRNSMPKAKASTAVRHLESDPVLDLHLDPASEATLASFPRNHFHTTFYSIYRANASELRGRFQMNQPIHGSVQVRTGLKHH